MKIAPALPWLLVPLLSCHAPGGGRSAPEGLAFRVETWELDNGMRVTLHPDPALPKVVINTWFGVGSKDEAPGRTGFAHLFEHLMFMGTGRVPDNAFDVIMERGGGSNNASTSSDRTNYYSMGPAKLLPTLLWLDADRLDALDDFMTQEKLDKQRAVVRNERRQTSENVPYGKAELLLPEALWPPDHPYHHPVIGSHEDLEAATVEDVVAFFRRFYVPANASLVVAGDFDPAEVRALVERTFGALHPEIPPPDLDVAPVELRETVRLEATDDVEFPKLFLAWHSPAYFAPGDGEMDLVAALLADGPSSRLVKRLVLETGLAQSVDAWQGSAELGSTFHIEALAAPGVDPVELRAALDEALAEFLALGPDPVALASVQAEREASFLESVEGLLERADRMNAYLRYFGTADGFQRDLERWTRPGAAAVRTVAREVLGRHRVEMIVRPEPEEPLASPLDARPADLPPRPFAPPAPEIAELSNGARVVTLARPGTQLVRGSLLVHGGESAFEESGAGRAALAARWIGSGAGGLDASAFAEAAKGLGGALSVQAGREHLVFGVDALTSRLEPTLDLFADLVRRPNLAQADFEREQKLALAEIAARGDDPTGVAALVARRLTFGDTIHGRPLSGTADGVRTASPDGLRARMGSLTDPTHATFVFAGDFDRARLLAALERRFGTWKADRPLDVPPPPPPTPAVGRLVLVDRPGAPQTVVYALRPIAPLDGVERETRAAVDTILGGTFTSRLNANLREEKGYTYGARSSIRREGDTSLFLASSAVFTDVTGPALVEFKGEIDGLRRDGVTAEELEKALETRRRRLVETFETTGRLAGALADRVANGIPVDGLAAELAALDGVTLEGADRVARSELYDWSKLTVVLVGDASAVVPQLTAAGFPEPTRVDADGHPVGD